MVKCVKFIRHYKLAYPFDHWSSMSLQQFPDLNTGKTDPEIDSSINNYLKENKLDFSNFEVVLTSSKRRTKETAEAINRYSGKPLEIIPLSCLDEIPSRFVKIPADEEFEEMKQKSALNINKERVLNKDKKIKRIEEIEKEISKLSYSRILVISHSYLIGLLNYWFNIINRDKKRFDVVKADKHEIGGVMEGFEVSF